MSRMIIILSVFLSLFVFYVGSGLIQQAKSTQLKSTALEGDIQKLKTAMIALSSLQDDPLGEISIYYRDFYEAVHFLGASYDIKNIVEVQGVSAGAGIEQTAVPSSWPGVQKLTVKVNFYELLGADQYMNIFESLHWLKARFPLNVTAIVQKARNLEMNFELYGKAKEAT